MPIISSAWLCGFTVTSWCRAFFGGFPSRTSRNICGLRRGILGVAGVTALMNNSANRVQHYHTTPKPPNILLYTGIGDTADQKYHQLKKCLSKSLDRDSYAMYRLNEEQVLIQPWSENTVLLVVAGCFEINKSVHRFFTDYIRQGGRILSLCSEFCHQVEHRPSDKAHKSCITVVETPPSIFDQAVSASVMCEPFFYEYTGSEKTTYKVLATSKSGEAIIVQVSEGTGMALLSLAHLDEEITNSNTKGNKWSTVQQQDNLMRQKLLSAVLRRLGIKCSSAEVPELTPAYLFASHTDEQELMTSLQPILKEGICKGIGLSLHFVLGEQAPPEVTEDVFPVVMSGSSVLHESVSFDWQTYRSHLTTNVLGRILLYSSVMTSTQCVFDGNYAFVGKIPKACGVIVVAGQQVNGKGRGGNAWLSPRGCLMFSLHVRVTFNSELGARLPYLQHIASLAVVEAVRTLPGYEEINICLKWPNDIYFGGDVKLGGVIVTSTAHDGCFSAVIGMGVNLSNSEPTICINEVIKRYNNEHRTQLKPLCAEVLLARTVSCIETLICDFQMNGSNSFQQKYYGRWLHSNKQVCLNTDGKPEEVTIKGLDDFGFLLVQKTSGQICSVQPDGNSFDMLKNMITVKNN